MSTTPIFTYYDARGRGEQIRILLNFVGEKYIDNRISELTDDIRKTLPFGQFPVYSESNDFKIAQSMAIGQYLARKFNLLGKNEQDSALIFSYVLSVDDLFNGFVASVSSDEAKVKLNTIIIPRHIGAWEKQLKSNHQSNGGKLLLIGNTVTWADLAMFNIIDYLVNFVKVESIFEQYPTCLQFLKQFSEIPQISEYIKNRPLNTPF